jgi:hypothetical protein
VVKIDVLDEQWHGLKNGSERFGFGRVHEELNPAALRRPQTKNNCARTMIL